MKYLLFFSILALLNSCRQKRPDPLSGKTDIPTFKLQVVDKADTVNSDRILRTKKILIVYFSPTCPYCKRETSEILAHIADLNQVQIVFLTPMPLDQTKEFIQQFNLQSYPTIVVAREVDHSFGRSFNPTAIPFLVVCNHLKPLIRLTGLTDITTLINILRA